MESWRITGADFYVSKSGSDAPATTGGPLDPFLTVARAVVEVENLPGIGTYRVVVGSGKYNERIIANENQNRIDFYADGRVVLSGPTTGGMIMSGTGSLTGSFNSFEFETVGTFENSNTIFEFSDCIFRNCQITGAIGYTRCIFISSNVYQGGGYFVTKCSFIGSALGWAGSDTGPHFVTDSFFDATSRILRLNVQATGFMDFNNYDFANGTQVELRDNNIDTTYTSLSSLRAAVPSWNQSSIAASPGFNNASTEDLTLSPSSPMAYVGSDGKHIGAWDLAISHGTTAGNAFDPAALGFASSNVVNNGVGWTLASNQTIGTVTSGYIDLGAFQTVGRIRLFGTQFGPGNVIDLDNSKDNPNRQTYELRWGLDQASLGNYESMEWGKVPSVNVDGGGNILMGNGDPNFEPNDEVPIQARVLQVRVTLRRDGLAG